MNSLAGLLRGDQRNALKDVNTQKLKTVPECEEAQKKFLYKARFSRVKAIGVAGLAPLACAGFVFIAFGAVKLFAFTIAVGLIFSALYPPLFLGIVVGASTVLVKVTKAIWGHFVSEVKANWQRANHYYVQAEKAAQHLKTLKKA